MTKQQETQALLVAKALYKVFALNKSSTSLEQKLPKIEASVVKRLDTIAFTKA